MSDITCPKCGYNEIALVKKELLGDGGYMRHYRCPRCSNTWSKKTNL